MEKKRTLLHCWWGECKLVQPLWGTLWRLFWKLKIELPYDQAVPLLGMYPDTVMLQNDICTSLFTAAVFTIAKTWTQPKCASTGERVKKMCYTCRVDHYSATEKDGIMPFAATWTDLESVTLSEVRKRKMETI